MACLQNLRFLILVSGWNCKPYVKKCLESILAQTYKNYCVSLVDDSSTDGTGEEILRMLTKHGAATRNWEFTKTPHNMGTVDARHLGKTVAQDKYDVIVWLDMDDELLPHALQTLAAYYEQNDVWLTYGNYINAAGKVPFHGALLHYPEHIHEQNAYRKHIWLFMHLRSYRRELYEKLTVDNLRGGPCYPDANMLYCMLELAGKERIGVIAEVLYKYNDRNPRSVLTRFEYSERKRELSAVQSLPPLQKLASL
jgi:glycosyltransferase involved in cell wall biosynthesis